MEQAQLDIPSCQDFQAILVGDLDGVLSIIDPVYLVWSVNKSVEPPSIEQSTLIIPLQSGINCDEFFHSLSFLEPAYFDALYAFWYAQQGSS